MLAGLCIDMGLLHLACAKLSVPLLQQKKSKNMAMDVPVAMLIND